MPFRKKKKPRIFGSENDGKMKNKYKQNLRVLMDESSFASTKKIFFFFCCSLTVWLLCKKWNNTRKRKILELLITCWYITCHSSFNSHHTSSPPFFKVNSPPLKKAIFITFNTLCMCPPFSDEEENESLNAFKLLPKSSSSSSSSCMIVVYMACAVIHLFVFTYYQSFNTNNHNIHKLPSFSFFPQSSSPHAVSAMSERQEWKSYPSRKDVRGREVGWVENFLLKCKSGSIGKSFNWTCSITLGLQVKKRNFNHLWMTLCHRWSKKERSWVKEMKSKEADWRWDLSSMWRIWVNFVRGN